METVKFWGYHLKCFELKSKITRNHKFKALSSVHTPQNWQQIGKTPDFPTVATPTI